MEKSEKIGGIAIFILTLLYCYYIYFTSWYWSLFPEDQIREVGLTTMFAKANIRIAILFHLIFLLLLWFIKPNYKEKEAPQVPVPE